MSTMGDGRAEHRSPEEKRTAVWGEVNRWLKDPSTGDAALAVARDRSQILIGYGVRELGGRNELPRVRPDLVQQSTALMGMWLPAVKSAEASRAEDGGIYGYAAAELKWNSWVDTLVGLEIRTNRSIVSGMGHESVNLQAKIKVGEELARISGAQQLVGAQ